MSYKLHVCSENDFPTAAGLASSAAGYACFVYTLATLYGLENEELTRIARLGSGSACRSIYGGFVQWQKGEQSDGSDSIAVQIAPASHWPEMRVLVLVVSDERKKVGSTTGMRNSIETSELLKHRVDVCVPQHVKRMTRAIKEKDFPVFGEITMKESNQFHAICLDTFPPCVYMNDQSHQVASFIHKYNDAAGVIRVSSKIYEKLKIKVILNDSVYAFQAAYTFDAGANACVYLLESEVPKFLAHLNVFFPNDSTPSYEYIRGIPVLLSAPSDEVWKIFIICLVLSAYRTILSNFSHFHYLGNPIDWS